MSAEQERTRYERQLASMPAEAKALAEWAAGPLLQTLVVLLRRLDVDPVAATSAALRVSRSTATHLYSEVRAYRKLKAMHARPLAALLLVLAPALAEAQTTSTFSWDYPDPPARVATYQQQVIVDGTVQTGAITCSPRAGAPTDTTCSIPITPLTPGTHTLEISATLNGVNALSRIAGVNPNNGPRNATNPRVTITVTVTVPEES